MESSSSSSSSTLLPLNELDKANFLQRLQSLQRLCSNSNDTNNDSTLSSILVIGGQDGRHNKGSMQIIKYLFTGSVSKDLLDGSVDMRHDCLEEIVLLIQETSVSVIWTHEMKNIISRYLNTYPMVIEYISTNDEENNVDLLQNRKCCDFKRMILESMKQGNGIGVPIPIGYDNSYDIESWPLLQSFALDEVLNCSTGFLTSRYNIFDISEYLDILFRTIDGYCIDNTIDIIKRNILPHALQTIGILNTVTADQRCRLTADDVIGPLDMLFEFGSMDCAFPPDPLSRPVALFSSDSSILGTIAALKNGWQNTAAGNSTHVVIEGCEPSSGMRWCRTYFLQKGKFLDALDNIDALVDENIENIDMNSFRSLSNVMSRLEAVYVKLWISLRRTVREAFAGNRDIFDAGSYIQNTMDTIMKGKEIVVDDGVSKISRLDSVSLIEKERLQVHMDCLDAFGRVVSIEDVDDMGGCCFTYIRVSVNGLLSNDGQECTIAVGDTFVFFPVSVRPQCRLGSSLLSSDVYCLTHPIPYYRSFVGKGIEEKSAERVLTCTRNLHKLPSLGLGCVVDTIGSGLLTIEMITDHALLPLITADIRLFTNGFVIEKMDVACLPVIVSMHIHVETMWTVSASDFLKEALKLTDGFVPELMEPDGVVVAFKLKSDKTHSAKVKDANTEILGLSLDDMQNQYNMLDRALPSISNEPTMIAFYVPNDSRGSSSILAVCKEWRNALRLLDIPEKRGVNLIPKSLFHSFLHATDSWTCSDNENTLFENSTMTSRSLREVEAVTIPCGYFSMKCMQVLAEYQRLGFSNGNYHLSRSDPIVKSKSPLFIVLGHAGSGVMHVGSQIGTRLNSRFAGKRKVRSHLLDCLQLKDNSIQNFISSVLGAKAYETDCTVVTVIISPMHYSQIVDIVTYIANEINGFLVQVISTICPSSAETSSKLGIGAETATAATLGIIHSDVCDIVIIVDGKNSKTINNSTNFENVQLFHITSMNMRLSEEIIDILEEKLSTFHNTDIFSTASLSKMILSGNLESPIICRLSQSPMIMDKKLLAFEIQNQPASLKADDVIWELSHLIIALKKLFPQASTPPVVSNLWSVPDNHCNLKGFKRILEISSIKLLTSKQYDDGMKLFLSRIENLSKNKSTDLKSIVDGALSVHGVIRVRNKGTSINKSVETAMKFNSQWAYVEATPGSIKVKPVDLIQGNVNTLTVMGVFSTADEEVIQSLFDYCYVKKLQPKPFLERGFVSDSQLLKLQDDANTVPLPDGWCFDGVGYLDGNIMMNSRSRFRPDINLFVDKYLAVKNQEISEYNNILKQYAHFL